MSNSKTGAIATATTLAVTVLLLGCGCKPPASVMLQPESEYAKGWMDGERQAEGNPLWIGGGLLCGAFGPLGASLMPTSPDTSALRGRDAQYVSGYRVGYQCAAKAKNTNYALAGWATWAVFYITVTSVED